jgi:uncharacterized protein YejL (UPF0352 family)
VKSIDSITDVLGLIVVTAMIGVIVGSKNTQGQIKALTSGFADVLRAATGQRSGR